MKHFLSSQSQQWYDVKRDSIFFSLNSKDPRNVSIINASDEEIGKETMMPPMSKSIIDSPEPLMICGRALPYEPSITSIQEQVNHSSNGPNFQTIGKNQVSHGHLKKKVVILGHDEAFCQTNNQVNTIFHAMDYARDINAHLALLRDTWPTKVLQLLFFRVTTAGTFGNGTHNNDVDLEGKWEEDMAHHLGIWIVDENDIAIKFEHMEVYYNTSESMYFYHTSASPKKIKEHRVPLLRYLWTHPSISNEISNKESKVMTDMCSVTRSVLNHPNEKYTVIHSRWMKGDQCTRRIGDLAYKIRKYWNVTQKSGIMLDKSAPCHLPPSYIQYIVETNGMLGNPIFVITDGKNPSIIRRLEEDEMIGKYVHLVPENASWVGGDMMLGVLADVFIGTPISTFSGNIARARAALGFPPSTNYLFPFMPTKKDDDGWEFFCKSDECLYNNGILSHYVG